MKQQQQQPAEQVVDVIVIGAGIGGLCCAALAAKYGLKTICLEAHEVPGGCAHSFTRYSPYASKSIPFTFDSGPSLLSGLSQKSTNPLRQVLDAIGTADMITWKTYDGWLLHDTGHRTTSDHNDNFSTMTSTSFATSTNKDEKKKHDNSRSSSPAASILRVTTGDSGAFERAIEQKAGPQARVAFDKFKHDILKPRGLAEVSAYIPPMALRGDGLAATVASLARYMFQLFRIGPTKGRLLTSAFTKSLDYYQMHDQFVRIWFDYLSFALSGVGADQTQGAAIAYMMKDLHKPGAVLDYPMGGMDTIVQALVTGLERHKGQLELRSCVEKILIQETNHKGSWNQEGCMAYGVQLANGTNIYARRGVVCNAPLWNMASLLESSVAVAATTGPGTATTTTAPPSGAIQRAVQRIRARADQMNITKSFMHLHLGIPKEGLPHDLECHHSIVNLTDDVTAEQNLVIISIPTVFDPSLAPEGYHTIHAYTAACDSFEPWEALLTSGNDTGLIEGDQPSSRAAIKAYRSTPTSASQYEALKAARVEVLWKAVELVIPDIRERSQRKGSVVLVGTPLTHRRYNRRYRGTYGPGPAPGKDVWDLPGASTEIQQLLVCGDTVFPGIGLPGVASSGTIAANTLVSVQQQTSLMKELIDKGALQR